MRRQAIKKDLVLSDAKSRQARPRLVPNLGALKKPIAYACVRASGKLSLRSKYKPLHEDERGREWVDYTTRGSSVTAEVYLRQVIDYLAPDRVLLGESASWAGRAFPMPCYLTIWPKKRRAEYRKRWESYLVPSSERAQRGAVVVTKLEGRERYAVQTSRWPKRLSKTEGHPKKKWHYIRASNTYELIGKLRRTVSVLAEERSYRHAVEYPVVCLEQSSDFFPFIALE